MVNIKNLVKEVEKDIISWRHDFHKHPELSFQEVETTKKIKKILEEIGYKNINVGNPVYPEIGLYVDLKEDSKEDTIALRADIDALPVCEQADVEYKSENEGIMHACGHDAHISMLLGVAKVLYNLKDKINGNVRFIFQPGEEMVDPKLKYCGAQILTEKSNYLDGVKAIFGCHIWGSLPTGKIYYKSGPLTTDNSFVDLEVKGIGGHASMPYLTIDPVVTLCQIVVGYQSIISRMINSLDPCVMTVSTIETDSNGAYNVIPEKARLKANIRTYGEDVRNDLINKMERMARGYADAVGASVNFKTTYGAPAVINNVELTRLAEKAVEENMGLEYLQEIRPESASEDFSFYLKKVPGFFFLVGCGNKEKETDFAQHHPKFKVDDYALKIGAGAMLSIVLKYFGI